MGLITFCKTCATTHEIIQQILRTTKMWQFIHVQIISYGFAKYSEVRRPFTLRGSSLLSCKEEMRVKRPATVCVIEATVDLKASKSFVLSL